MRLITALVCDSPSQSEREPVLKSILLNNARTPWIASIDYVEAGSVQERFHPWLVLIDLCPDPDRGLRVIPLVKKESIQPYVFVTGRNLSESTVLQALELGVTAVLDGEDLPAELEVAIEKIYQARTLSKRNAR